MLSESAVAKSENPAIHSAAVANADSLFERAVYGWNKPDRDDSPNITAIHRLFTPMEIDGRMKMVKLTVKETPQSAHGDQLYTVETVGFEDGNKGRAWIEASAREDGVDLRAKKIPSGGSESTKTPNLPGLELLELVSDPKAAPLGMRSQ